MTYAYDNAGQLTVVRSPQGHRTSLSYDAAGRVTARRLASGARASYAFDDGGRLTSLYNLKSSGAVISSFRYAYDNTLNRTRVIEENGDRVTWSYDKSYQLTRERRSVVNPYDTTFVYDATGNRTLKQSGSARTTSAYDAANQLRYSQDSTGRTTYAFDAAGNQQIVRQPSGSRTTYGWDYENQNTLVRLPDGTRVTMAYNADFRRVRKDT